VTHAGQEIATWRNTFPVGQYEYAAKHISGGSAEFQLLVFENGRLVGDPQSGTIDNQNNWASFNFDATGTEAKTKTKVTKTSRIPMPVTSNVSAPTIRSQNLGVRR
jgi:hypothetical protein